MSDLTSMTPEELASFLGELNQPKFRAEQLFRWLHQEGVRDYGQMTNLPKALREVLQERAPLWEPVAERRQVSALDGTIKYLWRLSDGNCVESVLMRYHHGNTVCVSCQAGCRMGCAFCASTLNGKARDLTPGEILDQVQFVQRDSGDRKSVV